MQERINLYLNRRFPVFLSYYEGICYFILILPILSFTIILLQPSGLYNWHEFHKNLVVVAYCITYLLTYAGMHIVINYFNPRYFNPDTWTIGKQYRLLLTVFLPATVCTTLAFVLINVEEFKLSIQSFFELQSYNSIISAYTVPVFGYFISIKLKHKTLPEEEATKEQPELPAEIVINCTPLIVDNICYAESKVNDLYLWILHNGELKEFKTRYTLKKLENELKPYSHFLRCQKSFIVNMHHLKDWDIVDDKMVIHPKYCNVEISLRCNKSETKEILRKHYVFKAK